MTIDAYLQKLQVSEKELLYIKMPEQISSELGCKVQCNIDPSVLQFIPHGSWIYAALLRCLRSWILTFISLCSKGIIPWDHKSKRAEY